MAGFNKVILDASLSDRFWGKVDRSGGADACWGWIGAKHGGGYGLIRCGKLCRAHRVSWEMEYGPVPEGLHVLHRCDNPPCVNPAHLFLGTHQDNMDDRTAKDRNPRGDQHPYKADPSRAARGERIGRSKMTRELVSWARKTFQAGGVSISALARTVGISHQGMRSIIIGKTWRHV
jgi:hypothetical protein